jgi:hypothetical protein
MRVWKMLYPSLTLQTIIKPFLPLLEKFSPAKHHSADIHETSLTAIETDDPALLFRYFDGFFVYGFFLAWAEEDLKQLFDPNIRDTSQRDFNYLKKIWARNLVSENQKRVIPKVFSLSVRIPKFLQAFPGAKILYMVRDPLETVPSCLSLITGVLENRFGFWNLSEEKRQAYINRIYNGLLDLSLTFHENYTSGAISDKSIMIVRYDRMMQDFEGLMAQIMEFVEESPAEEIVQIIKETSAKQRAYKSRHKYNLEKFGLDEAQIRKDYKPIYESFLS